MARLQRGDRAGAFVRTDPAVPGVRGPPARLADRADPRGVREGVRPGIGGPARRTHPRRLRSPGRTSAAQRPLLSVSCSAAGRARAPRLRRPAAEPGLRRPNVLPRRAHRPPPHRVRTRGKRSWRRGLAAAAHLAMVASSSASCTAQAANRPHPTAPDTGFPVMDAPCPQLTPSSLCSLQFRSRVQNRRSRSDTSREQSTCVRRYATSPPSGPGTRCSR